MDFTNFRFGVNTNSLVDTFTVNGTANVSGITKIFGNLVAASGVQAVDVNTGAFNVIGGAGITGNLYAGNLFANNLTGNISSGNLNVSEGSFTTLQSSNFSSGNAVITGGYINGLANLSATIAQITNFSTANAVISGGYISSLTNAYITTSNIVNFSTGNAVISGGYISGLSNITATTGNVASWTAAQLNSSLANVTTLVATNFSTGNAVINGGYITALANLTADTGNVQSWYATTLNATAANITTLQANNFSTANAVISGGYIASLSNASITTANIGNVKIDDVTISSLTGNLVLSPLSSNGNAVVVIAATSALQLPSGTTAQQPTPVTGGAFRWNSSTNNLEVYNGTSWVSLLSQINNQIITPDGVNSVYTLDYSTTAEGIIVSINGTLQQPGVAYTVAGTQITFAETPLNTDIISIRYIAAGTVTAENTQEINSANVALTTTPVIVDSFEQSTYRSAKYMTTTTAASSAEFAEFGIVHMGSTVAVSNVNRVVTGSTLTTFIANISGTTVRLWASTVSGTANIKLQKTYFVV